jgi:hypothetical protein
MTATIAEHYLSQKTVQLAEFVKVSTRAKQVLTLIFQDIRHDD